MMSTPSRPSAGRGSLRLGFDLHGLAFPHCHATLHVHANAHGHHKAILLSLNNSWLSQNWLPTSTPVSSRALFGRVPAGKHSAPAAAGLQSTGPSICLAGLIKGCIASRGPFEEVAGEQLAATVDQLLLAYNVQDPEVWASIITRLADEAAGMLSPAKAVAFGNLDPRFYVKVRARGSIQVPTPYHVTALCKEVGLLI